MKNNEYWFMQDSVLPHKTGSTFDTIISNNEFENQVITYQYENLYPNRLHWLLYSSDM